VSVTITTLENSGAGEYLQGVWDVTATSNDSNLTGIQFYLNNTLVSTDTTSPYTYTFDTTTINNQENLVLEARSLRSSGSPTMQSRTVIVNNPKPTTSVGVNNFPTSQTVTVESGANVNIANAESILEPFLIEMAILTALLIGYFGYRLILYPFFRKRV